MSENDLQSRVDLSNKLCLPLMNADENNEREREREEEGWSQGGERVTGGGREGGREREREGGNEGKRALWVVELTW